MLSQVAKVIISALLSAAGIILYCLFRGNTRQSCMLAMLFCTAGDVFMTGILNAGEMTTIVGGAFFMAGHVIYGLGFYWEGRRKGYSKRSRWLYAGIVLTAAAAAALGILTFRQEKPEAGMYPLILVYLAVIGFNLCSQFYYAGAERERYPHRLWIAVGMTLFLLSDFLVFIPMLGIGPGMNDPVWATYIPAQALILLFNAEFHKE